MPLNRQENYVYRSLFGPMRNLGPWQTHKLKRFGRVVQQVIDESERLADHSDKELRELASQYRQQAINGQSLDSLLVPAYGLVRQTSWRVLRMKHHPVQILGAICLHNGHIVQMATGEGKTLVSTMPAFLNALNDRGVQVVTVNDYLASRDSEEMGQVHRFLGLTVGTITSESTPEQRRRGYRCQITYVTNKELGFDFLRDQLRGQSKGWFEHGKRIDSLLLQKVQRPDFHFCIIDEADSILIDEARTPLIIANAPLVDEELSHEFMTAYRVSSTLQENVDFTFDRKEKRVEWLKSGEQRVTQLLGGQRSLSGHRIDWHEACFRALKANMLFHRDIEYVVENGEVVIVDENTGRKMPGRQWEEGLHQAVTAKEGLQIKGQTETLARTTYQIFFNRYEKISGMSGTVMTDARELAEIYDIGSLAMQTNRPCLRIVYPDLIFGSEAEKWAAVVEEVKHLVDQGRAILVGTRSIEKSDLLGELLTEAGVEHTVLNARNEAREAEIVKEAGQPQRVTVATNMAGRGTDIKLHPSVAEAGGLHVLGTERHESRRVDNQLVGRSARQGDPGSAQFFVSVEDPLIQRYRPRQSARLMRQFAGTGKPIEGWWIQRFFRSVQLSIEGQHRKIRYQLIKYDRERMKFNKQLGTE